MLVSMMVLAATAPFGRSFPSLPFHAVELSASASVTIEPSSTRSIDAFGDSDVLRCLSVTVRDDVLIIDWIDSKETRSVTGDPNGNEIVARAHKSCRRPSRNHPVHVRIKSPSIDGVTIRGHGSVSVASTSAKQFSADIGGSGEIRLAGLDAQSTRLSIGGSGRIYAAGNLGRLRTSIAGSGLIDAAASHALALETSLAGHGEITAWVDGQATGSLAGNGVIAVTGSPRCAIVKQGNGKILCPG